MSKVGIISSNNSGLDYIDHGNEFETIRSKITFGSVSYVDYLEISANEFYTRLSTNPNQIPTTAMASTGEIVQAFERLADNGFKEAIFICISTAMSGTYQNAVLAADMVSDKIKVHIHDSKSVGYTQGAQILKAKKLSDEGKSLDEIIKAIELMRSKTKIILAVDTLKYLVKNGRLSNAAGLVGTMLKIKPVLEIDSSKDGAVVQMEKIRTTSKAVKRMIEIVREETKGKEVEYYTIIHANNSELVEQIKAEMPDIDFIVAPLTPVVGAHAGPGSTGIGFCLK